MIQAVLFDMDGTLIDTEKYYRIFWPKALAACGYTMTDEQALTMRSLGRPLSACSSVMVKSKAALPGLTLPP